MMRPAGSSAAWLIRRPLDSFSILLLTVALTFCRLRRAPSAVTFVLICNPIYVCLLRELPVSEVCEMVCCLREPGADPVTVSTLLFPKSPAYYRHGLPLMGGQLIVSVRVWTTQHYGRAVVHLHNKCRIF